MKRIVLGLAFLLACMASPFASPPSSPPSTQASALWVAGEDVAVKVSAATGEPLLYVPVGEKIEAIGVDHRHGNLWVFGHKNLQAFDAQGLRFLSRELPKDLQKGQAVGLAVDGVAGQVWAASNKRVFRLALNGDLRATVTLPHKVKALSLDEDSSRLWVATQHHLHALDAHGNTLLSRDLREDDYDRVLDIAFDPSLDAIWVATSDGFLRYSPQGAIQIEQRRIPKENKEAVFKHIAVDGQGGLWAGSGRRLVHINRAGSYDFTLEPYSEAPARLVDVAADARDGSVWTANKDSLRHFGLDSRLLGETAAAQLGHIGVIRSLGFYADARAPELHLDDPADGAYLKTLRPTLSVSTTGEADLTTAEFTVDGSPSPITCTRQGEGMAACVPTANLPERSLLLGLSIASPSGLRSETVNVQVTLDVTAPVVILDQPAADRLINRTLFTVQGAVNEDAVVQVNGSNVFPGLDRRFEYEITGLREGGNAIAFSATDRAGNVTAFTRSLTVDTQPPALPQDGLIALGTLEQGEVSLSGAAGSVEAGSRVTLTNLRSGQSVTVTANADGSFSGRIAALEGDAIVIHTEDAAGNNSPEIQKQVGTALPPDPSRVAPALIPSGITPFHQSIAFLYSGSNPIQTGMVAGSLAPARAAVLRGQVLSVTGEALKGVTVSVHQHPEWGQTLSRADGRFDLAVNGGGGLVLNYRKTGYLSAQRQISVPWRDYAHLPDVVLTALDPQVTAINLASAQPIQTARGSVVTDADGSRQLTVLFPAGTTATITRPDGSRETLSTLHVRATEYTVGERGPQAMPGSLPPESGYTYAFELSVDEALARAVKVAGKDVEFNQPVPVYVDNFLNFPVGGIVPVGYYDADKAAWIAHPNGRVIKILGIDAQGLAQLDVKGTGTASDAAALSSLGITDAERTELARLYAPGKSLWRVAKRHFSTWDCNWPFGPPGGARGAGQGPPGGDKGGSCPVASGSIIQCEGQVLGETLPISGTPFNLNYRSERVLGRKVANSLDIPLSSTSLPPGLRRIELEVETAGQFYSREFSPAPNLRHRYQWDGRDAYGRTVNGQQTATVRIGYVYEAVYKTPAEFDQGFARPGANFIAGSRARQEVTLYQQHIAAVGAPDARSWGLAGWSLSGQHRYDSFANVLYEGNGFRTQPSEQRPVIETFAAINFSPHAVAVGPDGSVYVASNSGEAVIRRVSSDGSAQTIAGGGTSTSEGVPATQARIPLYVYGLDVGPDGSVYYASLGERRIRKIGPDGIVRTIAGTGVSGFSGDGGPAMAATFNGIWDVAVAPDGSVYVADLYNSRIRKIGTDGIIHTVAQIFEPYSVAVAPDGAVYFCNPSNLNRLAPDGSISLAAGGGSSSASGIPGTQARLNYATGLSVGRDGSVYFSETFGYRLRRLDTAGMIHTIVGNGSAGFTGDGGPAPQAQLLYPKGTAVSPDGVIYVADESAHRVRRISAPLPGFNPLESRLTSRDSGSLHRFDASGRHLSTVRTADGVALWSFAYDTAGYPISLTDGDGNTTTIERQGAIPTAIVAPDGQRTSLTVDAQGYLASVTNPAGETHRLQSTPDGLLTRFEPPLGNASNFGYDALGRLTTDFNAAGGGWTLARTENSNGHTTQMSSALGRQRAYLTENLATGDTRRTETAPDGSRQVSLEQGNGLNTVTAADGSRTETLWGPDPRFGMQAPLASSIKITLPSGLLSTTTVSRSAQLATPGNPLSLISLSQTVTRNGKTSQSVYTASTRRLLSTSPAGRQSVILSDAQDRPLRIEPAGLAPLSYVYDARGRLLSVSGGTGPDLRSTQYQYDAQGYLASVSDALGRETLLARDAVGRVLSQTLPGARNVQSSYDPNGNLASLSPPGRAAHQFAYTPVDLEQDYTPPGLGGTDPATRYRYNLDKDPSQILRPDAGTVDFSYQAAGQKLSTISFPSGAGGASLQHSSSYHPTTGLLTSLVSSAGQSLVYSYDGFLLTQEQSAGTVAGSVQYAYDSDLRIKTLSLNGQAIALAYDPDSLLIQAGEQSLARNAQTGLLSGTALQQISSTHSYSPFAELSEESARYTGSSPALLYQASYTRDKLGRITQKIETLGGSTSSLAYHYDSSGRLSQVERDGSVIGSYSYDPNGNRIEAVIPAQAGIECMPVSGVATASHDAQDRLIIYGDCTYAYSPHGELQEKRHSRAGGNPEVTQYQYDALGNLRAVTLPDNASIEYVIDGRNRRVGKKLDGRLIQGFLYQDQLEPIAELDAAGNVTTRFVYASKAHVPDYLVKGGQTYRIISDHLGSPRLIVNASTGEIAQQLDYDEWGNVTQDSNPGFQPFGFAGGIYDRDTKLSRFGARDYDAETGRWTAKDPIRFESNEVNLYGYTESDPINFIDITGEAKEHTSGARPSTKEKHEKGQARQQRDAGGEKGDKKRDPPRKRPPGHKGPWPGKIPGIPPILCPLCEYPISPEEWPPDSMCDA